MGRLKILLVLLGYNLTSFLAQGLLMCFMPIYFIGAIFWKDKTFDRLTDTLYEDIKAL